ncbi:MAG: hypothetical protein M3Z23_00490 [Acidobacteriota bacterium]|nr:hypothetical protein [Acidobacteriota bacterium]
MRSLRIILALLQAKFIKNGAEIPFRPLWKITPQRNQLAILETGDEPWIGPVNTVIEDQ